MSENQVKDHIVEEVKIAKETGKITSKKIHEIVRKAVADAVSEGKGGAEEIRPIVKDAMSAAVEGLKAAEADAALKYIGKLYRLEREAKQKKLSTEEVYRMRQEEAKPILEDFKKWLAQQAGLTPPKGFARQGDRVRPASMGPVDWLYQ